MNTKNLKSKFGSILLVFLVVIVIIGMIVPYLF